MSVFFDSINAISGCIILKGNAALVLLIPRKDSGCSVGRFAALSLKGNTLRHPRTGRLVARFTCDKGKQFRGGGSSPAIITGGGMKIKMLCGLHSVKFRDYVVVDR